jgi:glycosyltransferase involved in cell wall biosynthesis
MRILIATGIYPPKIGGPAQYAVSLKKAFESLGHSVTVLTYGSLEHAMPFGMRHLVVFFRALFLMPRIDLVIALDTISTGLPSVLAARCFGKRSMVRIGGDFLWESYVERTKQPVTLPGFYQKHLEFSWKERLIFRLQKLLLRFVDHVVYTTSWQKDLWKLPYEVPEEKSVLIENAYDLSFSASPPQTSKEEKIFLWAGRPITLKNLPLLIRVFERVTQKGIPARLECVTGISHAELMRKVRESYAMILPSFSDVSPNVILDGIREGKPFIMTKHTGIVERLPGAGFFIDPENEEEILQAIISMCREETYAQCQDALSKIHYTHSYTDIAQEFLALATRPTIF